MADITLSWPRLTRPALAWRQEPPCRWKMSATSSCGRRTAAGLHSGSQPPLGQWRKPVERAGHGADRGIGNARVEGRGVELGMTERTRAIMLAFYVIEIESSAEWDPMLASGATLSARDMRPGPPP